MNAYLIAEQSWQIWSQSDLKRQSFGTFSEQQQSDE